MFLRIISAEGESYRGDVEKVLLPTLTGMIGILPGHMNLVTPLSSGFVSYLPKDTPASTLQSFSDYTQSLSIGGGIVMIEDDIVTLVIE